MYTKVTVNTGQRKEFITRLKENHYEISVREKPERNLANRRICEMLFDHFNHPTGGVKIINGHHSRVKLVKIGE
jgi:uncharacterized protein YggU (UPF0235/DUF167 family)